MVRKCCIALVLVLAVTGALFAPTAYAQGEPTCAVATNETSGDEAEPTPGPVPADADAAVDADSAAAEPAVVCAEATAYPGPFTNMPATPVSPYSVPISLIPSSPVTVEVSTESPRAGLAHSGSEIFVLAYLGTGLLAFGAVALGLRRGSHAD